MLNFLNKKILSLIVEKFSRAILPNVHNMKNQLEILQRMDLSCTKNIINREILARVEIDAFFLELLRNFNVILMSKVFKIGKYIVIERNDFTRLTNYTRYIEAGITNEMPMESKVYMSTVNLTDDSCVNDIREVSICNKVSSCILPALGVVCESVLVFCIEKNFSGDYLEDIKNSYDFYMSRIIRG